MKKISGKGWDALATPVPGNVAACLVELGIEVYRESGEELIALCPLHFERTGKIDKHPSWSVNAETGIHHCFACRYKGPFVKLVEDVFKIDRSAAVAWVRARGGIERARRILDPIVPMVAKDTTKQVNEASLALMGFPPKKELKRRQLSFESVDKYGVLWDTDKRCWILPIRDPDTHQLWGWQEKNDRFFRNRPRDVRKSKTLFGLNAFTGDRAILVESPLDVVRLDSAGITGGLATFGASVSYQQMMIVHSLVDYVISAMDNPAIDAAGARSSEQLRVDWSQRLALRFLNYDGTTHKDVGDMTDEEIHRAIDTSVSSVMARFPHADRRATSLPGRGRKKVP